MESKETIRAAKVLILAGGILLIGIVMGFILSGNLSFSPTSQAREAATPAVNSLDSPFTQIADKTLFGTDFPSPGIPYIKPNLDAFRALPLAENVKEKILSKNALEMWPI